MKPPAEFRFDPSIHKYYLNDREIPSVTQVLEPLQELEGIPYTVLEVARTFGQHVHSACALMVKNELDWATLDTKLVPYVSAARDFIKDSGLVILRSEYSMCDSQLAIAGTLDIAGIIAKHFWILDWKSTSVMSRTVGLQLSGYELLYKPQMSAYRSAKRGGVQLRADGTYRLYPYTDARDRSWFLSALNIWHWRNSK